MNILGNSIKSIRKSKGMTQRELSEMTGFKQNTISNHENGNRQLDETDIRTYARALNISPQELFDVAGVSSPTPQVLNIDRKLHEPRHSDWISHGERLLEEQEAETTTINEPLYEYKVFEKLAAGNGYTYFNDGNFDIVFHDEKMDHDFASWVFGDSMEPTYLNGEVILIKQTGFDYDGAIYAVDWDGQTYIKKVYKEEAGLRLVSLNKKYADKFAPYDEDPRIIGKIVGHFQPMTT